MCVLKQSLKNYHIFWSSTDSRGSIYCHTMVPRHVQNIKVIQQTPHFRVTCICQTVGTIKPEVNSITTSWWEIKISFLSKVVQIIVYGVC